MNGDYCLSSLVPTLVVCRQLGWWTDDLTQSVALWGNFGKNAFSLDFRNKFDL